MALKLWEHNDRTLLPDLIPGGMKRAEKPEASCMPDAVPGTDYVTPVIWSQPCGVYCSHFTVGNA